MNKKARLKYAGYDGSSDCKVLSKIIDRLFWRPVNCNHYNAMWIIQRNTTEVASCNSQLLKISGYLLKNISIYRSKLETYLERNWLEWHNNYSVVFLNPKGLYFNYKGLIEFKRVIESLAARLR